MPQYQVKGEAKTEGIYMSKRVKDLLDEFSDRQSVSRRQIIDGALIEYFRKYNFAEETNAMLEVD